MADKTLPQDGRKRVRIEGVYPEIDGGRYPIKRVVGDTISVEIDAFVDGHDSIRCLLHYRKEGTTDWNEVSMDFLVNDRWRGAFKVTELGRYEYTFSAWVDHFKTWRYEFSKRIEPADIELALKIGSDLVKEASERTSGGDAEWLKSQAQHLVGSQDLEFRRRIALSDDLNYVMERYPDNHLATRYPQELVVSVDDKRAQYSTWYELFPRSCSPEPGKHGTFKDVEAFLPRIADMGFDVLYLPPIHPIGRVNRKGKNNTLNPGPDDVGSPWAIGAEEGGHKSVHPQLGTLEDFRRLVAKAKEFDIEVAMDIAFQCAPDHPYVKEHPSWFRWRPDGTVQYAENPPKKYQDIYPFNFETDDWKALWEELKSIFDFWIGYGVRIFRVDNPHTKPFPMWEWMIGELKKTTPDAIFLAEAFTRPKVMHNLAKGGYNQSYTYFTWRNTKWELNEYMTELTKTQGWEYFRPNFWPNTPDILPEYLQFGGRSGFMTRLVLAATMTANYGIYGPAFEMLEHEPVKHGSEEYLNSEKYEIRQRNLDVPEGLRDFITLVNRIRKGSPALQQNRTWRSHPTDNEEIICYSKSSEDMSDVVLVVASLDTRYKQSGWVSLDLSALGVDSQRPFEVHDLLSNDHFLWHGSHNYVELDPRKIPAHIFRLHRRVHTEQDFDYYMG